MRLSHQPHIRYTTKQLGFTLVEILLVVVIIGIMAGLASLAIGSNGPRQLQQEAVRLQQRLLMAQDEAAFSQKNLGLLFTEDGYQLLQYDAEEDHWQPLQNRTGNPSSGLIRGSGDYKYDIPVVLSLELDGASLKLSRDKPSVQYSASNPISGLGRNNKEDLQPELLLLANGESSPFTLNLRLKSDPRSTQTLHSDGVSPITRTGHNTEP